MGNLAVSIFGNNTPFSLTDLGDGSYALTTSPVSIPSTRAAGDKALSLFGINYPIRAVQLADGSYGLATAAPLNPRPAADAVASLFGLNIPIRLVGIGDGTYALGVAANYSSLSQVNNVAASIFGTNYPIRLVKQSAGDYALGVAVPITPMPAGDAIASLFGINPPTRLVSLGDGTYALAVGSGDVNAYVYLLRDDFLISEAAPVASPHTCTPGPGILTKVDTGNKSSISSDQLKWSSSTANFDPAWVGNTLFAAVSGRAFLFQITINANRSQFGCQLSTAPASASPDRRNVFDFNGLIIGIVGNDGTTPTGYAAYANSTVYQLAVVLQPTLKGAKYFIKGGIYSNWTLLWLDNISLAETQSRAPGIYAISTTSSANIDYIRVRDLGGSFATDTGIATLNVASPVTATNYAGDADGIIDLTVATATALDVTELRYRYQDSNNYWTAYFDAAGAFKVDSVVAGTPTNRVNVAGVMVLGHTVTMRIIANATKHNFYTLEGTAWTKRGAEVNVSTTMDAIKTVRPVKGANDTYTNLRSFPVRSSLYSVLSPT